jgi:hypothetical protein
MSCEYDARSPSSSEPYSIAQADEACMARIDSVVLIDAAALARKVGSSSTPSSAASALRAGAIAAISG